MRDQFSKFIVCLSFKQDPSLITSNQEIALAYFNRIQKHRQLFNRTLSSIYKEYLDLNHMTLIKRRDILFLITLS